MGTLLWRTRWLTLAAAALLAWCGERQCRAQIVRLGYVVPADRQPQPDGARNLAQAMLAVQDWYADQMERFGFGSKTFQLEMEFDGVTPKVHTVESSDTADYLRGNIWGRTISAASAAGLSAWSPGEIWIFVPEAHLQSPDGRIAGGAALGSGSGSGNNPGVAMIGSEMLFRAPPSALLDTSAYAGQAIPEIGPYPLVENVSFPWFEGSTISSIASAAQGALAHELGHAFGLPHDLRNDSNFDGNLMGNGLRGWRGSLFPGLFPEDDTQLTYGSALAMSTSRYFNASEPYTDTIAPVVNVLTSGAVDPNNGQLEIKFEVTDAGGIASAMLRRNGNQIAELQLTGETVSDSFLTPYFDAGQSDEYAVVVYDRMGNRRTAKVDITVNEGFNRAPRPFLNVDRSTVGVGETVVFDVGRSSDPDHSLNQLSVEWDLDGDGVFDTLPSFDLNYELLLDAPGARMVSARLTDPLGAWSVSAPLSVAAVPEPSTIVLLTLAVLCLGIFGWLRS